jgi:hypothetical protein
MIIDGHADVANMKAIILHDFHSPKESRKEAKSLNFNKHLL